MLQTAADWGLLAPHELRGFLQLQPIFPYFLRNRLQAQPELARAIETAFCHVYDGFAGAIFDLQQSKKPQERQLGQALAQLEYENLYTALNLALDQQVSILALHGVLSGYADATQDQTRGLALGEMVLAKLEAYPAETLRGQIGVELIGVVDDIASRQLLLKQYAAAEATYHRALELLGRQEMLDIGIRKRGKASIYHQLGSVAQEQRAWEQAEGYYQQALALFIEFKDRYSQASTYHNLGSVAQEQRAWEQAEGYYQQALAIYVEFKDRYSQASTYHQLGRVAQEQRAWEQAEGYYQQALAIYVEFNDRYSQASTYHNLGMVAQEQRAWEQAEGYYQQALAIYVEFNDRYEQAGTYHQLGSVAQEQRAWEQAEGYFLTAFRIAVDFKDEYRIGTRMLSLARLWQAGGDDSLPAAVAGILGATQEQVRTLFQRALDAGGATEADQ